MACQRVHCAAIQKTGAMKCCNETCPTLSGVNPPGSNHQPRLVPAPTASVESVHALIACNSPPTFPFPRVCVESSFLDSNPVFRPADHEGLQSLHTTLTYTAEDCQRCKLRSCPESSGAQETLVCVCVCVCFWDQSLS